jgi:hypothetical protein
MTLGQPTASRDHAEACRKMPPISLLKDRGCAFSSVAKGELWKQKPSHGTPKPLNGIAFFAMPL